MFTGSTKIIYLLLQSLVLHSWVFCRRPWHRFPLPRGLGLLQDRVLFLLPPPHVTEHVLHAFQLPQLPSTKDKAQKTQCVA